MKYAIIIAICLIAGYAFAQSTAMPIVMGYLSSSGCSGSLVSCFVPYTAANPMPVISN